MKPDIFKYSSELILYCGEDSCGNEILLHPKNKKHSAMIDDINRVVYFPLGENAHNELLYYSQTY